MDFASLILALASIALVAVVALVLPSTNEQAKASAAAAKAALEAAYAARVLATETARAAGAAEAAVAELQLSRELEYRPHLSIGIDPSEWQPGPPDVAHVTITNIGRGPALDCALGAEDYEAEQGHRRAAVGPFDLAVGAERTETIGLGTDGPSQRYRLLTDDIATEGATPLIAVTYADLRGTRYRTWLVGGTRSTEVFRRGAAADPEAPAWTRI
jgi:hypothetical protein